MKVSVVIAAYNHEKYVAAAIASALAQSYADFEVILVDDGSTDRTFEIAQGIRDPRLSCFRAARNRGTSATYNECLGRARGDYIAVLNSDDLFAPGKLERQAALLDARPEVAAVFSHAELVDEAGAPRTSLPGGARGFAAPNRDRHAWLRQFFFEGNSLCHPSVMIRRTVHDAVGGYDERFGQVHDLDLWIRVCLRHQIHVLQEPLVHFRIRDDEANSNNTRPGTVARIDWEYEHVARRFLDLTEHADFVRVFPEVDAAPAEWDDATRRYFLAKLAIAHPRPALRRLALELVHDLFGELGEAEMERRFGLTLAWLLRLTGDPELVYARPGS